MAKNLVVSLPDKMMDDAVELAAELGTSLPGMVLGLIEAWLCNDHPLECRMREIERRADETDERLAALEQCLNDDGYDVSWIEDSANLTWN
jgi:hypothetical protein